MSNGIVVDLGWARKAEEKDVSLVESLNKAWISETSVWTASVDASNLHIWGTTVLLFANKLFRFPEKIKYLFLAKKKK